MSTSRPLLESTATIAAVAAGATTAAGITALARGDSRGAPGVSKALSRLGKSVGGGMLTGVAVAAGAGTLTGLALYRGIQAGRTWRR
ncbi:MAG: hypothetical protein ABEK84_05875 [Salinibacter sp.]